MTRAWWHGPRHRGINPRALVATFVAAVLAMVGWFVVAGTQTPASAATMVSAQSCRTYDPNLVSGVCLSYAGVGGGTYFTWLGTYRAEDGRVFFCIDYRYDSAMQGTPRTVSTADLQNQLGQSVGADEVAALNYLIGRWAPSGPTGDANRDAAIALLIREVMSDGVATNGVVYPPGLKVGGFVLDPIGGLGGIVMDLARAMWSDASQFRGPWEIRVAPDSSAKSTVGTPRSFDVSVVSAGGLLVSGKTITFACTGPVQCPAPVDSLPLEPNKITLTPSGVGPYSVSASVEGAPAANGLLYDVGWSSHPGSMAQNSGPQRGWIAMANVETAAAAANAEGAPLEPVVSTVTSSPLVTSDTVLHDTVTVTDVPPGVPITASATLWGPYAAKPQANSCVPGTSVGTVTYTVASDGTYTTPTIKTRGVGYYTWTNHIPATATSVAVTTPCGIPAETTLRAARPHLTTKASTQSAQVGDSVHDTVAVTGLEGVSAAIDWALLGPLDPVNGSCVGVDWSSAATHASGDLAVTGDGIYETSPVRLPASGCFTYVESIAATPTILSASTPPGVPAETTLVTKRTPLLRTQVSSQHALTGSVLSDRIDVQGLSKRDAIEISWALLGPIAPQGLTCSGLDWSRAPIADQGQLSARGSGIVVTPDVRIDLPGCYTYQESVAETAATGSAVSPPGLPSETALVTRPPLPVVPAIPTGGVGHGAAPWWAVWLQVLW